MDYFALVVRLQFFYCAEKKSDLHEKSVTLPKIKERTIRSADHLYIIITLQLWSIPAHVFDTSGDLAKIRKRIRHGFWLLLSFFSGINFDFRFVDAPSICLFLPFLILVPSEDH